MEAVLDLRILRVFGGRGVIKGIDRRVVSAGDFVFLCAADEWVEAHLALETNQRGALVFRIGCAVARLGGNAQR